MYLILQELGIQSKLLVPGHEGHGTHVAVSALETTFSSVSDKDTPLGHNQRQSRQPMEHQRRRL